MTPVATSSQQGVTNNGTPSQTTTTQQSPALTTSFGGTTPTATNSMNNVLQNKQMEIQKKMSIYDSMSPDVLAERLRTGKEIV